MNNLKFDLSDDCASVAVHLDGGPDASVRLDADEIDRLLGELGEMRARMQPEVPYEPDLNGSFSVVSDPRWATHGEIMDGNSFFHVRDPRFGWLSYVLPRKEAQKLSVLLAKQADAGAAEPGSRSIN
jgi:hypothetical protein